MFGNRNLARAFAPPVLALGLALTLVRPLGADPVAAPSLPLTGAAAGTAAGSASRGTPGGPVTTSVPGVAFTELIRVVDGRIHTPVLVNAAEPGGTASIVGAEDGCLVTAEPGVVTWLDCALPARHTTVTVAVSLRDGRRFTHTAAPTIG